MSNTLEGYVKKIEELNKVLAKELTKYLDETKDEVNKNVCLCDEIKLCNIYLVFLDRLMREEKNLENISKIKKTSERLNLIEETCYF